MMSSDSGLKRLWILVKLLLQQLPAVAPILYSRLMAEGTHPFAKAENRWVLPQRRQT
jgi:hypothetical protein